MKVLLTGAFGNVGRSTLDALIARGHSVRIFDVDSPHNRKSAHSYEDHPSVEITWGDLRRSEDILHACSQDIDVVIHVAAIIPPLADKNLRLAETVNVGGTENLLKAIKSLKNPPRLMYTSSIAVYGDRVKNPYITVTDPVNPNDDDFYAQTKLSAERLIQEAGIEWAIFRLTYIVSPERLQMDPLMFHMPLRTSIEICHTKDVGVALANAVTCEEIWGHIFHIAGGEKCRTTYEDYIGVMMDIFGLGSDILPPEAFSTGKFHCGYMDTTRSQALLHYQEHTLDDYYQEVKKKVSSWSWITRFFKWAIREYLLNKSEFYERSHKISLTG
jgi:nucleoside-diphosphate-sugar epimerase